MKRGWFALLAGYGMGMSTTLLLWLEMQRTPSNVIAAAIIGICAGRGAWSFWRGLDKRGRKNVE